MLNIEDRRFEQFVYVNSDVGASNSKLKKMIFQCNKNKCIDRGVNAWQRVFTRKYNYVGILYMEYKTTCT